VHAVKVLKATIEGSVDKSVRTQAAAKFASDKPDVGRPVSVLHTEEDLSHRGLTRSLHTKEYLFHRKSHQKSTHKRSLTQSSTSLQQKDKKERKKERKHYFNLTQGTRTLTQLAHTKHNQQMKDLRFRATTSKLLFFFGSVNNSHVPKTKS
jgi:response regulator RpfG family c-di-GMP phosphodiesterase